MSFFETNGILLCIKFLEADRPYYALTEFLCMLLLASMTDTVNLDVVAQTKSPIDGV